MTPRWPDGEDYYVSNAVTNTQERLVWVQSRVALITILAVAQTILLLALCIGVWL